MAGPENAFDDFAGDEPVEPKAPAQPAPTTGTEQPPAERKEANPFDDFVEHDEDVMTEAPPPSPLESFVTNLKHGVGGLFKKAEQSQRKVEAERTVRVGTEKGIRQAGDSIFSGKPSQQEYDNALGDIAVLNAQRRQFDAFQSADTLEGRTAAILGGGIGNLIDPTVLLPVGIVGKTIAGITEAAGAGEILSHIAARAGEFGAFTAAADAVDQGLDIYAGYQNGFDAQRTVLAGALGAGIGVTVGGATVLIKGLTGNMPRQATAALEGSAGAREAPPGTPREPGPLLEHGFDDAVAAREEELGARPTAKEEAQHAAFEEEVGPTLRQTMEQLEIEPTQYDAIRKLYARQEGESVDTALNRAIDDWETELSRPLDSVIDEVPGLRRALQQAEPPARGDTPPAEWQPAPEQMEEATRLSRGWPARQLGQRPQSLINFVRKNGGLRLGTPEAAELQASDLGRQPGLLRREGKQADLMAQSALDAGYDLPTNDIGSGVDVDAFVKAVIEDGGKRVRHYPQGLDTEGYFENERYVNDTLRYLKEDLGVNPKGMEPRQIAWLLSQERAYERASAKVSGPEPGVPEGGRAEPREPGQPAEAGQREQPSGEPGGVRPGEAGTAQGAEGPRAERVEGPSLVYDALAKEFTPEQIEAARQAAPQFVRDELDMLIAMGANKGGAASRDAQRFVEIVRNYQTAPLKTERTAQGDQPVLMDVGRATPEEMAARERAAQKEEAEARMRGRKQAGVGQESAEDTPLFGGERQAGLLDQDPMNQDALFLTGGARLPQGPAAETRRLSVRGQLPGERETIVGPKAPVTDAEARNLKLEQTMKELAARLGRRFEVDHRVERGALGMYKPKEGVLRARFAGDVETFSHELGHAVDQRLRTGDPTKQAWANAQLVYDGELRAMDFNAVVNGTPPTVTEGTAEFLRTYITNPAYATRQAPGFAGAFKNILARDPELAGILNDAANMAKVESGLSPTQVFTTMIGGDEKNPLENMSASVARHGIVPTMQDYVARLYGAAVRESIHADRLAQFLRDAMFEKTGKPLDKLNYSQDPSFRFRQMPGAQQSAIGIIDKGVPLDPMDPIRSPRSVALVPGVARALNGSFSRLENDNDPLVKAFNGYLVSRRAMADWQRFEAGELRNQPVRASKSETERAIADFERQYPAFKAAGDDVFAFRRAYMQRLVDRGFISAESAQLMLQAHPDHVPLYRVFEEGVGGGAPSSLEHADLHRFMGSTRDVKNVVRSVIEDVAAWERQIAHNEVWTAIDDWAAQAGEFAAPIWERIPSADLKGTTIDAENVIRQVAKEAGMSKADTDLLITQMSPMTGQDLTATIWRNEATKAGPGERIAFFWKGGQRQAGKMGNNDVAAHFFDLMTAMSAPEKDLFLKAVGAVNAGFQSAITHAPRFLLGTAVRDNMTRMFIPRAQGIAGRIPFVQDLVGGYTMLFDRAFYRAYQQAGGIRGGLYSHAANELNQDALEAAARSSGFLTRTLDELQAANTLGAKAAVIADVPASATRASADYIASLGRRIAYAQGLPAQGWAVLTTPFKMVGDALRLAEMTETASRVGNARLTYNYLKRQGLNDVEAFNGGMYESRDVLNYQSRGGQMRGLARLAPYLQAGITGADRSARGLVGEPVMAAYRAYERGGYANLDARDKAILSAAWKNWLYVGASVGLIPSVYYPTVHETEFYRRASQYMRETYYLLQTGTDADGNPVGLTIHKGYDIPAALANSAEIFAEEMRKHDPVNWWHVMSGLKEAVPRQFRSANEFLGGFPAPKVAYEVATGQKMGFHGGPPRLIVPESLRSKPIEQQVSATTSWMAQKIGHGMGVSPMVVDHVIGGMGGTGGQDIRDLSSAIFDNNPLTNVGDAMNRFFFGQIYRTAKNDVGSGHDLRDLMARDHGKYQIQANGYRDAVEEGRRADADALYNKADNGAKTLMTLQANSRFDPDTRTLHPLVRSQAIATVVYDMMKGLAQSRIMIADPTHQRGQPRKMIQLSEEQARQVHAQLNGILAEETRNGLAMVKQPGYEDFPVIDSSERTAILRSISPEVAKEFEKRMKRMHVLPAPGVAAVWPEAEQRLLKDQGMARLRDLLPRARGRASP